MIREMNADDIVNISGLVRRVFDEFVGCGYSDKGNGVFYDYISPGAMTQRLCAGNIFFLDYREGKPAGMIEVRDNNHISLFFVETAFHGRGVGGALFREILLKIGRHTNFIEVNSSPYAVEIYRKLGFSETGPETEKNGIIFVPMRRELDTD